MTKPGSSATNLLNVLNETNSKALTSEDDFDDSENVCV